MAALIAVALCCPFAPAQEVERTFVTTTGKATVYTVPTHVGFWMHRTVTADKLNLALEESTKVDPAIREAFTLKELHPTMLETSTPAIVSALDNTVRVSTEIRFSMSPFVTGEAAMIKFGELCEQIKGIADGLGSELTGPHFLTTEKATVTQEAVQEAAKEAYPAAAGAAEAVGVAIHSVEQMDVGTIT